MLSCVESTIFNGGMHLKAHFALKNESWQEKLLNKEHKI
ncbi:hypothetical protein L291_4116 [Acinetobacter guillouiae MSP4-18]|nr:hypothetical protein L291_4116 [Acinetobacter guillouiae MSP4-18]